MAERTIFEGRVVTMNDRFVVHDEGRVYVDGPTIAAVQPASRPAPDGWDDARLVRTGDTLYPGLIELHNHLSYNALPLWQTPQRFDNRGQWMRHRDYRRFVSGPASVLGRTGGFLDALKRRGIDLPKSRVVEAGYTFESGVAAAEQLLGGKKRPTAIFCGNDEMAAGVYRVALRAGGAGAHYQLAVYPLQRKAQLRRTTGDGGTRYLAIATDVASVKGLDRANELRLRAFNVTSGPERGSCRIVAFVCSVTMREPAV